MQENPRILSASPIGVKEWVDNTTSIYEMGYFLTVKWLPPFISNHLVSFYNYLNKFDTIIGIRLFINRRNFDILISNSNQQAITYSLLNYFPGKSRKLHFLSEIYLQKPVRLRQRIKLFFTKPLLKSVDYIRVSATNEILNYSALLDTDKNRFWFLPFSSWFPNPGIVRSDEGYILSAGKQYRDYATLVNAIEGTGYKLIIVSDYNSMKGVKTCKEVTVLYNIGRDKYLDLLFKSSFVVVPLSNDFSSCGQIAFLEAMTYGKAVIVADVTGSRDYFVDGKSALFYERSNYEDLRSKIILLSDNKALREKLAKEALSAIKNSLNSDVFVMKYLQFIRDKWREMNIC